jgi:hypothetical protein
MNRNNRYNNCSRNNTNSIECKLYVTIIVIIKRKRKTYYHTAKNSKIQPPPLANYCVKR